MKFNFTQWIYEKEIGKEVLILPGNMNTINDSMDDNTILQLRSIKPKIVYVYVTLDEWEDSLLEDILETSYKYLIGKPLNPEELVSFMKYLLTNTLKDDDLDSSLLPSNMNLIEHYNRTCPFKHRLTKIFGNVILVPYTDNMSSALYDKIISSEKVLNPCYFF